MTKTNSRPRKSAPKKSTSKTKTVSSRRSRGGIGITRRAGKFEATYTIPLSQLPPGSPRKRITAWGETERIATRALIDKLRMSNLEPALPEKLTSQQVSETRTILGADGRDVKGSKKQKYDNDLGPTLKQWAKEWEEDWIGGVQESTKNIYRGHIQTYILPYLGDYHLNELSARVLKSKWWEPIGNLKKVAKDGTVTDTPLLGHERQNLVTASMVNICKPANARNSIYFDPILLSFKLIC